MRNSFYLLAATSLALAASSLVACGGSTHPVDPDGAGGSSGSGGTGGSGGSCEHAGNTYADGMTVPAGDGCNTCFCDDGLVSCTLVDCQDGCSHNGNFYPVGASFPASDGCNSCTCAESETVLCTEIACNPSCESTASDYWAAMDQAKECEPWEPNQCTQLVIEGPVCGIQAFVNPANGDALANASALRDAYVQQSCAVEVACPPSLPATSSYCSASGHCETVRGNGGNGVACHVEGFTYPSGSALVPDPFSCNTCDCIDGQLLNCTDAACPEPCAPNAVPGTQCVQCGPTDGCEVVEHTCLQICAEGCVSGQCSNGVCKALCG